MLVSSKADPSKKKSFIDRYDTFVASRSTSEGLDLGVIGSFIHDGVIGKRLVEYARETLETNGGTLRCKHSGEV